MKKAHSLALLTTIVAIAGCTYRPSFSDRATYDAVQRARELAAPAQGPVAIAWSPTSFPDRVDTIGPSGQEGAATRTVLPTGAMLTSRTAELLEVAVGVSASSDKVVTIDVREATTSYRYSQGFVGQRRIASVRCTVDVELGVDDVRWEEQLVAETSEAQTGKHGETLVEMAWDEIALGLVASVVTDLPDRPARVVAPAAPASTSTPPPPAPVTVTPTTVAPTTVAPSPSPPTATPTVTEEIEALRRILIRKRLITEAEWDEVVAEVMRGRD